MAEDERNTDSGEYQPVGQSFALAQSFYIDTDAYTDRDREMFVAGYEFAQVWKALKHPNYAGTTIHRENESRVRMAAGQLGREVMITPCEEEHDPDGTWSYLEVKPQ